MILEKKVRSKRYWLTSLALSAMVLAIICVFSFTGETTTVQAGSNVGSPFIYDNAPISTGTTTMSGVNAPAGSQWSELQENPNNDSNTTLGAGCQQVTTTTPPANNRCADDFTVPAGQTWTITQVVDFAYQTGFTGGTSPFISANLRIWNGRPGDVGSTIIFGDTTTNRLASSTNTNTFRIGNTTGGNGGVNPATAGTTRRIWQNNMNVSPALVLTAGTYWIDFQFNAGASGNFVPLGTILGSRGLPSWNARQFLGASSTWQNLIDIGEPTVVAPNPQPNVVPDIPMDFAFKLVGSISGGVTPQKPNVDFDGDGKSDFSVVRDETPALTGSTSINRGEAGRVRMRMLEESQGQNNLPEGSSAGSSLVWYNHNSSNGTARIAGFGTAATDLVVPADYDGDGKADLAVWRATGPTSASFFILQSSNNTVRVEIFGQQGDNPQVVGDYDGDGKADVATFRCPPAGGQCFFFYRGTLNNPNGNITFVPWGNGTPFTLFPNVGDFDGDGKNDFCLQRTDPSAPGKGQFVLLRSSDFGVEYINWGLNNDFIVPGDYDGDGKSDFMVRRNGSNPYQWYLLTRTGGGTGASPIFWGIPGDVMTPGDYDGDGKTDIAIWRPSATPANNLFYVRRSTDGSLQGFKWGLQNDTPTANWIVQ